MRFLSKKSNTLLSSLLRFLPDRLKLRISRNLQKNQSNIIKDIRIRTKNAHAHAQPCTPETLEKIRSLQTLARTTNQHKSATDLLLLERIAELHLLPKSVSRFFLRVLLWLYVLISNGGRSIIRPLISMGLAWASFAALFIAISEPIRFTIFSIQNLNTQIISKIFSYSLYNMAPIISLLTDTRTLAQNLFGGLSFWVLLFSGLETIISIVLLYLLISAVRRHFSTK